MENKEKIKNFMEKYIRIVMCGDTYFKVKYNIDTDIEKTTRDDDLTSLYLDSYWCTKCKKYENYNIIKHIENHINNGDE